MQTGQYSTQIFSLAVLLSSLFVYNQMGGIDEAALDRLSLVTEMSKHIRVRASDGAVADPSELAAFTPSFIWLLRDFYLKLEENGQSLAPRDYLEAALQSLPGSGSGTVAKNQIRESIKALFPDRDCFTLVRPVNEEDALARLDTLPAAQLRPEFRDGLSRLARLIFAKALPKRLGAQVLTGPLLAGLAEAYVAAINGGAVPTIATAWQGVAEAESRRAADAAEAAYAAAFPSTIAADDAALAAAHQGAMAAAQREFDAVAIGDEAIRAANEKRWRQSCEAKFKELREKKLATAELACERAIAKGTAALQAVVRKEGATLEDLARELAAFKQSYTSSAEVTGPSKWPRFSQFVVEVYANAQRDLAAKQMEAQRAAAAVAQQTLAAVQAEARQAAARAAAAESSTGALQARIADLERQLAQVNADLAAERKTSAANAAHLAEVQQSAAGRDAERAALTMQLTQLRQSEAQLLAQVGSLQQELGAARAEAAAAINQAASAAAGAQAWEAEKGRLHAALDAVTAARDAALSENERAKQMLDEAMGKVISDLAVVDELQAKIASLTEQVHTANAKAAAAAQEARPAPAWSPPSPSAPPMPSGEDAEMAEGQEHEQAAPAAPSQQARGSPPPDTKKMTVNGMKEWLMGHGHEAAVWELSQKKAKKKDFEEFIKGLAAA